MTSEHARADFGEPVDEPEPWVHAVHEDDAPNDRSDEPVDDLDPDFDLSALEAAVAEMGLSYDEGGDDGVGHLFGPSGTEVAEERSDELFAPSGRSWSDPSDPRELFGDGEPEDGAPVGGLTIHDESEDRWDAFAAVDAEVEERTEVPMVDPYASLEVDDEVTVVSGPVTDEPELVHPPQPEPVEPVSWQTAGPAADSSAFDAHDELLGAPPPADTREPEVEPAAADRWSQPDEEPVAADRWSLPDEEPSAADAWSQPDAADSHDEALRPEPQAAEDLAGQQDLLSAPLRDDPDADDRYDLPASADDENAFDWESVLGGTSDPESFGALEATGTTEEPVAATPEDDVPPEDLEVAPIDLGHFVARRLDGGRTRKRKLIGRR